MLKLYVSLGNLINITNTLASFCDFYIISKKLFFYPAVPDFFKFNRNKNFFLFGVCYHLSQCNFSGSKRWGIVFFSAG